MQNVKEYLLVTLKGIAMGAADVVPGVSGGTIAFISGIYERLIQAIRNIVPNLKLIFKGQFKAFWKNIDGTFLLSLVLGIVISLFTLAHLMTYLLDNHPIQVWSFFCGLVLASTVFVGRDVKWNWKTALAFLVFTVLAFFITSPANAPISPGHAWWFLFLSGAIAICAMILPGISGSFILVLLGQYYFLLEAIKTLNIPIILIFVAGALIGILSFSNVLAWLFKHFKMITLASLTGFMLGSLNKIWPWKQTLSNYTDSEGIVRPLTEKNILPGTFENLTGESSALWSAILLAIVGFALIFLLEEISRRLKKQ